MLDYLYLNGEILASGKASLGVADLAILRGYGVFDYFRFAGGGPRFLDDHLARFHQSAAGLGLEVPVSDGDLRQMVAELIDRNGVADGGIRFVLTGGYADDGYSPVAPNLLVIPYAFTPPRQELYAEGCAVMLHAYERQLPRLKTIDYVEGIRIQPELRRRGADYALYVDRQGNVRESDRSNYMIVKDGTLIAPVDDILLGITRKHLLQLARKLDIPVAERAVSVQELREADEALICSSVKGAMPIRRVDDRALGGDAGAGVVRKLMRGWREVI